MSSLNENSSYSALIGFEHRHEQFDERKKRLNKIIIDNEKISKFSTKLNFDYSLGQLDRKLHLSNYEYSYDDIDPDSESIYKNH